MSREPALHHAPAPTGHRKAGTIRRLRAAITGPEGNGHAVRRVTQIGLDRITCLVGDALRVPAVCASIVDMEGQLIASAYGIPTANALLVSYALRTHVTASRRPLIVHDGARDPAMGHNPAIRDGTVVACLGMPLRRTNGRLTGTLLAMDERPRRWSGLETALFHRLGALIEDEIEMAAAWRQVLQRPSVVTGPSPW